MTFNAVEAAVMPTLRLQSTEWHSSSCDVHWGRYGLAWGGFRRVPAQHLLALNPFDYYVNNTSNTVTFEVIPFRSYRALLCLFM